MTSRHTSKDIRVCRSSSALRSSASYLEERVRQWYHRVLSDQGFYLGGDQGFYLPGILSGGRPGILSGEGRQAVSMLIAVYTPW